MSQIGAEYEIEVLDSSGNAVITKSAESDSFVVNFVRLIEAGMKNANVSVVDLGGTARSCRSFTCTITEDAGGITTRHILVGSGTTPVSPGDYALARQIPNSILFYHPVVVLPKPPYIDGDFIKSNIATRTFSNESDDLVSISEIGISVLASGYNVLILRDVLSEPIEVPVGGAVRISYVFKSPRNSGFTLNYMRALACSFDGSALIPVVDTAGVPRSVNFTGTFPANASAAQGHYGVQVGTSDAVSIGDEYSLGAPILHGSENGQLSHGATSFTSTVVDDGTIEFSARRGFINLTSLPITIREIGLVAHHSGYNILLERNVIDPIEIPPYDGVNVTITHRTVI